MINLACIGRNIFLGFTRMALSLWAMTMLSLYIRVQVNILGRHLYIDTARGFESSYFLVRACFLFPSYIKLFIQTHNTLFCSSELLVSIIMCSLFSSWRHFANPYRIILNLCNLAQLISLLMKKFSSYNEIIILAILLLSNMKYGV